MILWTQCRLFKLGQLCCHNPWFVLWIQKCIMNYTSKCFLFGGMVSWIFENFMKFYELVVKFSLWNPHIDEFLVTFQNINNM
jgi:hypothetical protein